MAVAVARVVELVVAALGAGLMAGAARAAMGDTVNAMVTGIAAAVVEEVMVVAAAAVAAAVGAAGGEEG